MQFLIGGIPLYQDNIIPMHCFYEFIKYLAKKSVKNIFGAW